MLFKLETVTSCPITRASQGKILLRAFIVQAIRDCLIKERGEEWLIVLTGTRSDDGLDIQCDGIIIPEKQQRSTANVTIDEMDVTPEMVCVLHSHHSMGAFFSGTDNTRLNPKFPSSIVVSTRVESVQGVHLGFEYKAEGKVLLPCGSLGIVPMLVEVGDIESWPRETPKGMATHETLPVTDNLNGCSKQVNSGDGIYWEQRGTQCGVRQNVEVAVTPLITLPEGQAVDIAAQLPPARWGYFQGQQGQGGVYRWNGGALERVPDKSQGTETKENGSQGETKHYVPAYVPGRVRERADWDAWAGYYDDWDDLTYPLANQRNRFLPSPAQETMEMEAGGRVKSDEELEAEADEFLEREAILLNEEYIERVTAYMRANPGANVDDENFEDEFELWLEQEELKADMAHEMALAAQMGSDKD